MITSVRQTNDTIVTGGTDRTLRVWNAQTGVCMHVLRGHEGEIECIDVDQNVIVSGSTDNTLRVITHSCLAFSNAQIWSLSDGRCVGVLRGHDAAVTCCQLSQGRVASGSADKTIRLWSLTTLACLAELRGHEDHVFCLQMDANHLVSGCAH